MIPEARLPKFNEVSKKACHFFSRLKIFDIFPKYEDSAFANRITSVVNFERCYFTQSFANKDHSAVYAICPKDDEDKDYFARIQAKGKDYLICETRNILGIRPVVK